ncbi:DUF1501 domain-containing protein [Rubinisphaera sp.]|mgnify:CR=1 FL=1|uniref:DUF1501 domain-containing protein n=1 Tax=Rubinisphaera sp. TaxID=2024857 RepID=UPI000C0DBFD2|nr:DUF1501 domain-containing protein [Rubinisphaera sp.]MBV10795.1 hypothetical protein [Rubinisphaera sp.]|tara:strand:- start:1114 stop:2454 length:1341 start_codon:yes stop_codon:yes gene_type:complete
MKFIDRNFVRRDVLQLGSLFALGLGTADLLNLSKIARADEVGLRLKPRSKSCILIWLDGGPSHLETFDLKPDAPIEVRGPLESISTSIPGVHLSESLPEMAKMIEKFAIIRSMTSPLGEHNFGTHYLMTGYKPTPVLEYPTLGGVASHLSRSQTVLPQNLAIPDFQVGGGNLSGAGYLPSNHAPFSISGDPAKPDFQVEDLELAQGLDSARLLRRQRYVHQLSELNSFGGGSKNSFSDLDRSVELVSSPTAREAFQIDQESPKTRQKYGPRTIGQSCLLARRLIERGATFVTVNNRGWDTHNDLITRLKDGYTGAKKPVGLIPSLDLALSGLVNDLDERGLLEQTLVVVMGEFGRTPKLNSAGGRDHWPRVFSVALAGGGIRAAQLIGASDATGESPADRPVTPSDLAATIYTLLGIDPQLELKTTDGRPVRLTPHDAQVIQELVG